MNPYATRTDDSFLEGGVHEKGLGMVQIPPFALRLPAWPELTLALRKRLGLPRRLTDHASAWITGIACIVAAALLFLAVTLALGVMLKGFGGMVEASQQSKSLLAKAIAADNALDDARGALRRNGGSSSALQKAQAALSTANEVLRTLRSTPLAGSEARLVATMFARDVRAIRDELPAGSDADVAAVRQSLLQTQTALAQIDPAEGRGGTAAVLAPGAIDSSMLTAMLLGFIAALAAPSLGVWGLYLLRRERGREKAEQLQMELRHAQRLAVMGEMAATLAHEVSHPLTAANNYMAALRRTASAASTIESEKVISLSERTAQQIIRASQILLRLRRFIEKRQAERGLMAPAALVAESITLLGVADFGVEVIDETDERAPDICIDRVQMQQVLVNLMRNAIEAMKDCPKRRLAVAAACPEPGFVVFSLSDTGPGLPEDLAGKLFQPFNSTKKDGLGIGLSICRAIIEDHHGSIWAEPNPEGGTVFRFRLPAASGIERHKAMR